MNQDRAAIAVLYNAPVLPPDDPLYRSEADVVAVAKAIVAALDRGGFEAWEQPAAPPLTALVAELEGTAPDVIFNLIEGFGGRSGGESAITGLLQLIGLPYTGCPAESQSLCHQKGRTKALLRGFGLPTAPFLVISDDGPIDPPFPGPYFVKPDAEDASLGIDQMSVVEANGLRSRVGSIRAKFGPHVIVEAYLPGREFNVGILGLPDPVALPLAEIVYDRRSNQWPILTYDAKWDVGSPADLASPARCPAVLPADLAVRLSDLAVRAFRATGCRDYARVDFRLDAAGEPMILEVNPNPDIGPSAGWARALKVSGRDYDATIVALARQALDRGVST